MSKPGGRSAQRSAISTSSVSLSAVQSFVLTTIGMGPVYWLCSTRSQPARALAWWGPPATTHNIPVQTAFLSPVVASSGEDGALPEQTFELAHQAVAAVHVELRW